ncbi:MAG: GIY-YIG nuclease family protein [Salinivirgaceae bacterium]|nr:GIY-YIG nuclease family protein [Salinivirgaceae bacterium]
MKYAIIDIETTGGNPKTEKITEIAIYVHDGEKVIDEYSTLVNPEKGIPPFITGLTGISNEMVENAPKFFEVAKEIVNRTEDTIFVGHNANFDYSFIKQEFKSLGYDYQRKTLDTVRLSRKLIPGHASYSLGKLCNDLNINIRGRHRAAGDALATVKLFEILLSKQEAFAELANPEKFKLLKGIDSSFHRELLEKIPEKTGVYYFFDNENKLIYIGKSTNIKKRVAQHLRNSAAKKAIEMRQRIFQVSCEITGSELVALLWESEEIKKHKPIYNKQQRRTLFSVGLYANYDINGYANLKLEKISKKHGEPVATFSNMPEAQKYFYAQIEKYLLCQKLCGLYKTEGACFHHGVSMCKGACIGKESHLDYNKRVKELIANFEYQVSNFLIIDKGRSLHENSAILVENGQYRGFGYFDSRFVKSKQDMIDSIKSYKDNRDIQQIIKSYVRHDKYQKIIYIEQL